MTDPNDRGPGAPRPGQPDIAEPRVTRPAGSGAAPAGDAASGPDGARREGAYADPPAAEARPEAMGATAAAGSMAPGTAGGAAADRAMAAPRTDPGAERAEHRREEAPTSRAEARARLLTTALPFGWKGMLGFGILTLLGGIAAILAPFLASLTVAAFAAATFVILGAATLWMAFKGDEMVVPHRLMNGAIGALMIVFGVLLFANPIEGLLSLTILVAAFFVAEGAMRVWLGIRSRGERDGAGWLILGGALSIVLGVMVFLGLPATSIFVLGLFLGIDLLGTGIAMIALSFAERKATGDAAPT